MDEEIHNTLQMSNSISLYTSLFRHRDSENKHYIHYNKIISQTITYLQPTETCVTVYSTSMFRYQHINNVNHSTLVLNTSRRELACKHDKHRLPENMHQNSAGSEVTSESD